ncbi:NACHT domain-containing protein [Nocardia goodfellowii]
MPFYDLKHVKAGRDLSINHRDNSTHHHHYSATATPRAPGSNPVVKYSDKLADAVQRIEQAQQRELRAAGHHSMQVMFRTTPRINPAGIGGTEPVHAIATYFELLQPTHRRRLLVLGAPGSGKTVAATYLILGLLESRAGLDSSHRTNTPVPTRINAAGWDGKQDFARWLAARLRRDYRLRPAVARKLIEHRLILPVIDGLDEMDDELRTERARALLDLLNKGQWRDLPVAVMCRTTRFVQLVQPRGDTGLDGATTITLQPLDFGVAEKYLAGQQDETATAQPAWTQVRAHLGTHRDGPLDVSLRNPWMLGLTAATLSHTPELADELLACTEEEAIRDLLFAAQIPAAVKATEDGRRYRDYTEQNVEKWLHVLAVCFQDRRDTERDGTAIRLDEIWEFAHKYTAFDVCALVVGLLCGGSVALVGGFFSTAGAEVVNEYSVWLGLGAVGLVAVTFSEPEISIGIGLAWRVPGRSRWRKGLASGLEHGLERGLFGIFLGVILTPIFTVLVAVLGAFPGGFTSVVTGMLSFAARMLGFMLVFAVTFGLLIGLIVGLTVGLKTTAEDQLAIGTAEQRVIRDNLQAAVLFGIMITVAIWLALGLGLVLDGGGTDVAHRWLFGTGLGCGSLAALGVGLTAERFVVAVLVFKLTAEFPARPAVFLAWARRHNLLRVSVNAYQFRHPTYQSWILRPHPGMADTSHTCPDSTPRQE